MNLFKLGPILTLSLLVGLVGCSSKDGEESGSSTSDVNASGAYGSNGSGIGGGMNGNGGAGDLGYGRDGLRIVNVYYFEYDSAELRADAFPSLDQLASNMKSNNQNIVLEGFTDERGSREYNMALGERRAMAVQNYLSTQGISSSQIEIVSYGEERPAMSGQSEDAWSQNRRVEVRMR